MRIVFYLLLTAGLLSQTAPGQTLRLKTRQIDTAGAAGVRELRSPRAFRPGHLLLQFDGPVSPETIAKLKARGIKVLQDVPDNGLLVSVHRRVAIDDMAVRFAAPLEIADKVSPLIVEGGGFFLIEFHPDVDINEARQLLLSLGFELNENPDLSANHLMIHTDDVARLEAIAALDEVAYIFPAADELAAGLPMKPCAGAVTVNGPTGQSIPTYGEGWDGPGQGAAALSYVFSRMSSKLDPLAAQGEIVRAMAEWSRAVQVTWTPGTNSIGPRTVNILFGTGNHGDGYPFDGLNGVLAHTFYPSPPNPEPIAGDMHFDDAENWRIGANIDLYSVALHELGHALGLGHSDSPGAVMYPYYKMVSALSPLDVSVAQTLYALPGSTPVTPPTPPTPPVNPPAAAPLTLKIAIPASTTTASQISLSGSATGGTGTIVIAWSTDRGASGLAQGSSAAWTIASVPLITGTNTIRVTATDTTSNVSQSIVVTRQAIFVPTGDTTPPTVTITYPGTATMSTSASSIAVSGVAGDNVGVTAVSWSTNTGGAGAAGGLSNWKTAAIPLYFGTNVVTIRASDASGNVGWRTVMITRR